MAKFIHLRVHTEYSLCSGTMKIKELIRQLRQRQTPAAAITDSHNMFGILEYSLEALREGIQPIIGCEALVDVGEFLGGEKISGTAEENFCKLVLLAKTETGLSNLISLISQSYLTRQEHLKPHLRLRDMAVKNEGLLVLSGGGNGVLSKILAGGYTDGLRAAMDFFREFFSRDFYVEISRHGLPDEMMWEPELLTIAKDYNLPLVATNDCYFQDEDTYEAQDALTCIATGRYLAEVDRPRLTREHYLKTEDAMVELFRDLPEAVSNTVVIAQRISATVLPQKPRLPHFDLPPEVREEDEIRRLARLGLEQRLERKFVLDHIVDEIQQEQLTLQYRQQLEYELDVITQMDFSGYFLIVADFIVWSKTHDVPVGPGRGSGAGSVVAWSLRITELDPLKFGLFFERFLNPERVSLPDFDVDFCQKNRAKTIDYVQTKYGRDRVAQIITFGKLQSRAVVKDVGRVLGMGYTEVDKISKMIPFNATLDEALQLDPNLGAKRQNDPDLAKLFDIALRLEGLNRHSSIHAAGLVIAAEPLERFCPLYFDQYAEMPVIQYDKKYCEEAGLIKFDFLGLKTLTVIHDAVDFIARIRSRQLDLDQLDLQDKCTFDLLQRADTLGVFQVESAGMLSVLRQVKPDNLEDLVALISLYRPGPMGNIPTYIARKHGLEKVDYRHPQLEEILRDTYGVIIYQEQVMNIAKSLAGYTLGAADLLRRAMGKKIKEEMDKQRSVFVEGCRRHSQMSDTLSGEIFDLMAKFAEYGFPKAHATAYALISYQTAYLKANFPVEFMTATLNMEIMDTDKISYYLQDVKRHHWKILLPDINKSDAFFGVELVTPTSDIGPDATNGHAGKELAIRYGLGALKGIGPELMAEVVEERSRNGSFRDIFDFCRRMGPRIINKKTLESLAKSGSFDELHPNRRQICESGEILGNYAKAVALEESSSQISLFEDWDRNRKLLPQLVQMEDWCGHERFQGEFEVFGFYPTHHPLDILAEELKAQGIIFWEQLEANGAANFTALLAGVILSTSIRSNDRGRYAHITMSDPTGIAELFFYGGDLLSNYQHLLDDREHRQVVCECGVRKDETGMRLSVKDLWSLDDYLRLPKSKRSSRAAVVKPLLSPADIPLVSLKIHLAGERGLEELAQLLSKVQLPDCPPTRLEIITADDTVQLPDIYHLTQLDAKRIKDIYGVTAVEMEPNSSCRDGADSSSS